MRALITGIEGFVGPYLAKLLLSHGMEVYGTYKPGSAVNIPKIATSSLDVTNYEAVVKVINDCQPDYVFHLAAQSSVSRAWKNPALTINVNVIGTINLLEAVRNNLANSKVLLVGSGEEYGPVKQDDLPIKEETILQANNPYALSKLTQGYSGLLYHRAYGVKVYMVRAFNHTGPGQPAWFVIPDFCKQIAGIEADRKEPIISVGNLSAQRDFSDVRDVVKAYWCIVQKGRPGGFYNVGSGKAIAIRHILDILISKANISITVEVDKEKYRPVDTPIVVCDNTKLLKETGWKPEYDLETTLEDVLNFWRNQIQIDSLK